MTGRVRRTSGATLVECCVAVGVLGILAGIAAPSLEQLRLRKAAEGLAAQVAADVHFARTESITRNQGVRFDILPAASGSCYVVHTGGKKECSCGPDDVPVCKPSVLALRGRLVRAAEGVTLTANVDGISFDERHGTASPAATLEVRTRDGRVINDVVSIMGRVSVCSPGGSMPGQVACVEKP